MQIDTWSPKIIGVCDNPYHKKIEKKLTKTCLNISKKIKSGGEDWITKTYNTLSTYSIHKDNRFNNLNNWITDKIKEYANSINYMDKYYCKSSWFNIYKKHDFQEYHTHSHHSLSAVYFLKSDPKKSAKIYFKLDGDPYVTCPQVKEYNNLNSYKAWYEAVPGRLLIFKSNLPHCVEKSVEKDIRISLSYNFNNDC
tara:strand:+ start:14 stop:601 length:588 start_codon:yes stop_codon:yes gene_type:complete